MKKFIYLGILLLFTASAYSQTVIPPGDYHGANLTLAAGQQLTGGHYYNIGTFTIPSGVTVSVARNTGVVRITATQIAIRGVLNGNAAGYAGGSIPSCPGANGGLNGGGPGGGTGGAYGPSVHGNGGAGGGHGGNGGDSGNAFSFAVPQPSLGGLANGDITTASIDMGSGGGSGSNYFNCESIGGRGGAGGAGFHFESSNFLLTGQILARGENGFAGQQFGTNMFASGGGGAGGGVLISGSGTIGGLIDVNGGSGANSPNNGFSIGGGGGSGGRIKIFGSFTNTAVMRIVGGAAGISFATAASQSKPGQAGVITTVSTTPTISASVLDASEFCAGAQNISVSFTTTGSFSTSNIFTAQLSNASGDFSSPVNIGTSSTSGTILTTLPVNISAGSGYRIRVVSSDPVIIGDNNGSNLTINSLPSASIAGSTSICPGSSANVTITLTGEGPWAGVYNNGVDNVPFVATATPFVLNVTPILTTTYTLVSVSDANCNRTLNGSATITVGDGEAPVPVLAALPILTAECGLTATPPAATDNCAGAVVATTTDLTTFDSQGTFTITWTYSDSHGNTSTQQQTVVIDDVTSPVLDTSVGSDFLTITSECAVTIDVAPTANDNCSGAITGVTNDPLTYSEQGTFLVNWNFDDGNGNVLSVVQTVIIDDTTAPVLAAPLADITGQCGITMTEFPTAEDNCAGTITATTTDELTFSEEGTYTITWSFDDGNGNILEADQTVIIDDTEAPVLDGVLIDLNAQCDLSITSMPTATDNCAGTITATTADPLTYTGEGTYTIHWKFDDGHGNVLEATQNVVIDDTEAPVLDAPLTNITSQCGITVSVIPTATDNCAASITGTTTDPLTYTAEGNYTINWKFDDGNGNVLEVAQSVVIDDTEAPVPSDENLPTISAGCSATVSVVPVATDNCAGAINGVTTDPLTYTLPGTYTITWTFNDGNGNTATQTQSVVVDDSTSPVIPTVVFTISSAPSANACGKAVQFADPVPTDNCSVVRFERTDDTGLVSGDIFPAGTTVISYEAEDAAGNITEASFSVTIVNDAPVINSITGPTVATLVNTYVTISAAYVDDNPGSASINWGDGAVTNGTISTATITGSHRYTDAGTYTIIVELEDACGEVVEKSYSVVIYDQNGGHVTGAGLLNSPRDAYSLDRNASCVAAFEFNIKYKNGRALPEGKTEFRLLGSNMRFKSTSYDWLTIVDDFAVYQGKGELNGQRGFSFAVSVVDVHKNGNNSGHWILNFDKFRIRIWNAAGVVVYDNERGTANNAEPVTPILGAIVIHKATRSNTTPGLRKEAPVMTQEFSVESTATVYPNPFIDAITLEIDPEVKVNPTIQLFDNSGRPVYDRQHTYQESGTYSVNLGQAAAKSGMYLLRVTQGDRVKVIKVFGGAR